MAVVSQRWSEDEHVVDSEFVDHFRCPEHYGTISLKPADIVQNLRYERYMSEPANRKQLTRSLIKQAYYLVRPLLAVPVRRHLQKLWFRDWRQIEFPRWPVDTTVEHVFDQMMGLALRSHGEKEIPFIWFWPNGAPSAVVMTHDVETEAGRNFCEQLIDIDEEFGIPSSFQVVPEGRYIITPRYLDAIRARGHEVNVHDLNHDGHLFSNHPEFLRRAKLINAYGRRFGAAGFRSAALYRNLEWIETLDFSYDMSVPNVGHLEAQRGGCCSVFPFFAGKMVELPVTTTQDYSLFQILNDYSIELWKKQLSLISERHGMASFITHPDYLISRRPRETYRKLLGHLHQMREEHRTWFALPGAVSQWWRDRSRMRLVQRAGSWEIVGQGKELARVAFARLEGGRIAHRLKSILAIFILDNATAEAVTDSAATSPEVLFPLPLVMLVATAIRIVSQTERPFERLKNLASYARHAAGHLWSAFADWDHVGLRAKG